MSVLQMLLSMNTVSRKWRLSAVIRPQPTGTVLTGADITDLGYNLNNRTHQHPA